MFFSRKIAAPPIRPERLYETDKFILKLAGTKAEIEKAFKLRYQIFNVEKGLGTPSPSSKWTQLDVDQFDEFCSHLIVVDKKSGNVVGTYRINLPKNLDKKPKAFYSACEYEIVGLDDIADQTMEVGRTCVATEYRNGSVIALLWSGIGKLLNLTGLRYLLGCASLETADPAMAWALYKHFRTEGRISKNLFAYPRADFEMDKVSIDKVSELLKNKPLLFHNIPSLLKAYFRLGANVCGEPVFDREFKTIDFLISLDTKVSPPRYIKRFMER